MGGIVAVGLSSGAVCLPESEYVNSVRVENCSFQKLTQWKALDIYLHGSIPLTKSLGFIAAGCAA
jgi:hypothetical protein